MGASYAVTNGAETHSVKRLPAAYLAFMQVDGFLHFPEGQLAAHVTAAKQ